jgi:molecular chaperone GrpE
MHGEMMSNDPTSADTKVDTSNKDAAESVEPLTEEPLVLAIDPLDDLAVCQEKLKKVTANYRAVSKAYAQKESEMAAYRKRMTAKAKIQGDQRAAQAVEKFFEPVQNLKRSMSIEDSDPATIVQGVRMVLSQFDAALCALGLAEVPGVGTRFDPLHHEALAIVPVEDAMLDGVVTQVYMAGYRVGERVLTPAQVVVGKYTAPVSEE